MRALAPVSVLVFIAMLALGIATRLDDLAAATLAGVLAGVMASVPASILFLLAMQPKKGERKPREEKPQVVYIVWKGRGEPPVFGEAGAENAAFPVLEVSLPEVRR